MELSRTNSRATRSPRAGSIPFSEILSFNPYEGENNRNNQAYINRTGPQCELSADTVYRSYRTNMDYKVDHSFSDNHKIFARFSDFRNRSFNGRWQVNVANPIFDYNTTPIPLDLTQLVLSDTLTISPTMINEIRLGGTRRKFTPRARKPRAGLGRPIGNPNVSPETMPTFLDASGEQHACSLSRAGSRWRSTRASASRKT